MVTDATYLCDKQVITKFICITQHNLMKNNHKAVSQIGLCHTWWPL